MYQDDLKHFGVLGMKWGVRKDGSTGRRRKAESEDYKKYKQARKKKPKQLSNEELKGLNERMSLEQNYKRLKAQDISAGQKFIKDVAVGVRSDLARDGLKKGIKKGAKYVMKHEELMHIEEGKDFIEHFGVLGMHWGVRKYRNKDGSLTPAGKAKQQKKDNKQTVKNYNKMAKIKNKERTSNLKEAKKKNKPLIKSYNQTARDAKVVLLANGTFDKVDDDMAKKWKPKMKDAVDGDYTTSKNYPGYVADYNNTLQAEVDKYVKKELGSETMNKVYDYAELIGDKRRRV